MAEKYSQSGPTAFERSVVRIGLIVIAIIVIMALPTAAVAIQLLGRLFVEGK